MFGLYVQASSLQGSSAELQAQVTDLQSNLEAAQEALANSRSAAAAQTARLAHLEGEFEALQVRKQNVLPYRRLVPLLLIRQTAASLPQRTWIWLDMIKQLMVCTGCVSQHSCSATYLDSYSNGVTFSSGTNIKTCM